MTTRNVLKMFFNPIRDGGAKKAPVPTTSPVTFPKVGMSFQNFLTFSW